MGLRTKGARFSGQECFHARIICSTLIKYAKFFFSHGSKLGLDFSLSSIAVQLRNIRPLARKIQPTLSSLLHRLHTIFQVRGYKSGESVIIERLYINVKQDFIFCGGNIFGFCLYV